MRFLADAGLSPKTIEITLHFDYFSVYCKKVATFLQNATK